MSEHPFTIVVDLDGTLATYVGWEGEATFGEPIQSCMDMLQTLHNFGWRIVISTCRTNGAFPETDYEASYNHVKKWLDDHAVPYDHIATQNEGKPFGHVYLDDRAVRWNLNTDSPEYAMDRLKSILWMAKDWDTFVEVMRNFK